MLTMLSGNWALAFAGQQLISNMGALLLLIVH
jgi:hypothetical protein